MPKIQPFPPGFLEHTTEHHLARYKSGFGLYLVVVASCLLAIALLPFIYVDVTVKSPGSLRTATQVSHLRATAAGYIKEIYAGENMEVRKGMVLFEIQSPMLEEKQRFLQRRAAEITAFVHDLQLLKTLHLHAIDANDNLLTPYYRQALLDYRQQHADKIRRLDKIKADHARNKKLYDERVIAEADFENFVFELDKASGEVAMLWQNQITKWLLELKSYEREWHDNQNELQQLSREKEHLNVVAPVSGTIQNLAGLYRGSAVFANQDLAQISPDTLLLGIMLVSPAHVGLLREGMNVNMQVTAFNYNEWGLLTGQIQKISNDVQLHDNQPVFEVRCSLDKNWLRLKNGYVGKLKKGMTVQGRFVVTRRSLWNLLYDKVDNWMNPNIMNR